MTAEAAFAFFLMYGVTLIVVSGQYGALALGRRFIDEALASTDAAIGINVSDILTWMRRYPNLLSIIRWAYETLGLQLLLAIPVLRLLRERDAIWEFVFHYHFCLIVALLASALWPVAGPYQWFHYSTPVDLDRVVKQVNGFHDGSLTVLDWEELDGLISNRRFTRRGTLRDLVGSQTVVAPRSDGRGQWIVDPGHISARHSLRDGHACRRPSLRCEPVNVPVHQALSLFSIVVG
jgi:hypothetical protein